MFIVLLFKRIVVLALVVVALGLVAFVLGRPFVERLAARSIEDRLGTPVSVSIATSISPGIARGDLGNVTVRAREFERDGLRLAGAHAVYRGVHVELSDLISGDVRLRYSSVSFQGGLTNAALGLYLRQVLAARGIPSKQLLVTIDQGVASLRMGTQHAAVRARIVGPSSIKLVPISGSKPLMRALGAPIQLGPLPDGVHLTGIALRKGRATLTGRGEGGELRA